MFNRNLYENSRPDGIPVLAIVPPKEPKEGEPRLFVPLKRTELHGEIAGPLAHLRLVQVYGYTRAQTDKTLETIYRFPLPGDAAVTAVRVRFGDVEIEAELKERKQAELEYEQAKKEGRQAALATRESPDVFTLRVAGLQPDQDITVETRYLQLARAQGAGWTLRVPLTTSPRYVRGDELTSRHAHGQPLAVFRDPGHRFSLDLFLRAGGAVSSATHALVTGMEAGGVRIRLRDGEVLPDRDCVLAWTPEQQAGRTALTVLQHPEPVSGHTYFLALAAPPAAHPACPLGAREAILLVDHSGSMSGAKWEAADWAVKQFLLGLTERDTFALGLFHNETAWYAGEPRRAAPAEVDKAIAFLTSRKDSGGTELGVALEQALSLRRDSDERARHLLIVTDAEVNDAGRILRLADGESRRKDRRRISVLCIDAAPNAFLATQLAERGGGVSRFLTSAPDEEDITTALDEVLTDWAEPVLIGARLTVGSKSVEAAGHDVSAVGGGPPSIDLGDLPLGRPLWVCGRVLTGAAPLPYRLTASSPAGSLAEASGQPTDANLGALFGARRVAGIEYLMASGLTGDELATALQRLGYDPGKHLTATVAPKVYAENVRDAVREALRELLVSESLRYGIASAETAFVAVRKEKGKVVEGTAAVANALPAGWSGEFESLDSGTFMRVARPAPPPRKAGGMRAKMAQFGAGFSGLPSIPAMSVSMGPPQMAAAPEPASLSREVAVFLGRPAFAAGQAVLIDTSVAGGGLPDAGTITELRLIFPAGTPAAATLDAGLAILIFVDDLSTPRARVRLADLVRQGLKRPLNLRRRKGDLVRIVLADANGAWTGAVPEVGISLLWS